MRDLDKVQRDDDLIKENKKKMREDSEISGLKVRGRDISLQRPGGRIEFMDISSFLDKHPGR